MRFLLMNSGDSDASDFSDTVLKDLTILPGDNEDIRATKSVLSALYNTSKSVNEAVYLPCNESGSTLRFMIPVAGYAYVASAWVEIITVLKS